MANHLDTEGFLINS